MELHLESGASAPAVGITLSGKETDGAMGWFERTTGIAMTVAHPHLYYVEASLRCAEQTSSSASAEFFKIGIRLLSSQIFGRSMKATAAVLRVALDQVIETMRQTGADMFSKYRETPRGGLAINVPGC